MAYQARVSYTANGSTVTFSFSFSYISSSHVKAYVNGVEDTSITFPTTSSVTLSSTPASGAIVLIKRVTPIDSRLVDFQDGSVLSATDLDKSADQNFFVAQETSDTAQSHLGISDTTNQYDAGASGSNLRIINVANPTGNQDAATKHYLENTWLSSSDKTNLTAVAAVSSEIALLGVSGVITDMGILGTADVVSDMNTLGTADVVSDMNTLATSDVVSDMNTLATSAIVTDLDLLGTSANVTAMGLLGNSTTVTNMGLLGIAGVITDMGLLGTSAVVTDLDLLATSANVTAMGLLGNSTTITDLGILGTSAIVTDLDAVADKVTEIGRLGTSDAVADLALLGTSAVVTDLGLLGTSANVTAMGVLGTSGNVTAMGLLGNSATVTDLGLLGTSAIVTDLDLLATSANVTAMGLLGTSANVTAQGLLGTSANVTAMGLLGNSSVIADMALLGTSDAVADMAILATTDIVADLAQLATTDFVADLNQLATTDFVADLTAIEAVKADVTTVADNLAGVTSFAERYRVGGTNPSSSLDEGDLFFNTSDNALKYYNGSSWASITAGIGSMADDTSPQLGGDLDLNGNNIDFPTTANISDCLDEDNMASNSATKLATQQSIKAYADSIEGSVVTTEGNTFANYNQITANVTTTLVSTKNYMLVGLITVADTYTWDVAGTGTLTII